MRPPYLAQCIEVGSGCPYWLNLRDVYWVRPQSGRGVEVWDLNGHRLGSSAAHRFRRPVPPNPPPEGE